MPQKIRLRNLDEEVINAFRQNSKLIDFDSLSEDVVTAIKNQSPDGSLNKYNDRELRNRISLLERDKLDSETAANLYLTIEKGVTKEDVNNIKSEIVSEINTTIDNKIAAIDDVYIKNINGIISESLLSDDLQDKINLRYENNRTESITESGGINTGEFNKLVIKVDRNTSDIQNLQSYVNSNVLHTDDKIYINQLDTNIQNILNNVRVKTEPISINDVDADLQDRLSLNSEDIQSIKEIQNSFNGSTGQTFFSVLDETTGKSSLQAKFIVANDTWIVRNSDLIMDAEADAMTNTEHDIYFLVDSDANILYEYNYETSLWELSDKSSYGFAAGRIIPEYKTGDLYFSSAQDEYECILRISNFVEESEITDVVRKNEISDVVRIDQLMEYAKQDSVDSIINDINELKEIVKDIPTISNNISTINQKLTELEQRIAALE